MLRSQCPACPWRHMDDPDLPFTSAVIEAAAAGEKFVCHTRMGPCDGPTFAGIAPDGPERAPARSTA